MVNRYGLMTRSAALMLTGPSRPSSFAPPKRPSKVAAWIGLNGLQLLVLGPLVLLGVLFLTRLGTLPEFIASLTLAFVLGAVWTPLGNRGRRTWATRSKEWEQAMREWRALRYCRRCHQVFR